MAPAQKSGPAMLEHAQLWLSAPTEAGPFAPGVRGAVRVVLDPDTRATLGYVVQPARRWPWQRGRRFTVYEAPDASLVCTGWAVGWLWRTTAVHEADGNLVAVVRGDYILAPAGGLYAVHRPGPGGTSGQFIGPMGEELAAWDKDGVGTRIEFRTPIQDEPFVKM